MPWGIYLSPAERALLTRKTNVTPSPTFDIYKPNRVYLVECSTCGTKMQRVCYTTPEALGEACDEHLSIAGNEAHCLAVVRLDKQGLVPTR